MKTPAIIASLTVVGSIAFAAGQGTTSNPPKPRTSDIQESDSQPRLVMAGCQTNPSVWFDPIPKQITLCVGSNTIGNTVGRLPLTAADVNADGQVEYFDILNGQDVRVFSSEVPVTSDKPLLMVSVTESTPSGTVVLRNSVLDVGSVAGNAIRDLLVSQGFTTVRNIMVSPSGWRDVDHDGDLDLLCSVYWLTWSTNDNYSRDFWFENIGYEKPAPPLAADINRDGRVDGADLGLVLVSWGTSP
jgi:hypothetical protein